MAAASGEALLGDLVGLITKHLKKGERTRIAGLGKIKATKKVAFRAAKELKLAV